ncbi:MAG: hypothetical protein Q9167_002121, partial [Letrouitia subvulpina]
YAVEGLVESMLYELDTFNVRLTLVEPGHVRRDDDDDNDNDNGDNGAQLPIADAAHFTVIKAASEPYAAPTAPAGHAKRMVQWLGEGRRHRPTSAVRSAEVVWQVAHCGFPPLRLLLGAFAVESVRDRLRCVIEEIEDWKYLGFGPQGEEGKEEAEDGAGGGGDGREGEMRDEGEDEEMEEEEEAAERKEEDEKDEEDKEES